MSSPARRLKRRKRKANPHAERRKRKPKPPVEQFVVFEPDLVSSRDAMLAAARAAGCTCRPDIVVCDLHRRAAIFHDEWCALLRQGEAN
jgi:hypothetical protein